MARDWRPVTVDNQKAVINPTPSPYPFWLKAQNCKPELWRYVVILFYCMAVLSFHNTATKQYNFITILLYLYIILCRILVTVVFENTVPYDVYIPPATSLSLRMYGVPMRHYCHAMKLFYYITILIHTIIIHFYVMGVLLYRHHFIKNKNIAISGTKP